MTHSYDTLSESSAQLVGAIQQAGIDFTPIGLDLAMLAKECPADPTVADAACEYFMGQSSTARDYDRATLQALTVAIITRPSEHRVTDVAERAINLFKRDSMFTIPFLDKLGSVSLALESTANKAILAAQNDSAVAETYIEQIGNLGDTPDTKKRAIQFASLSIYARCNFIGRAVMHEGKLVAQGDIADRNGRNYWVTERDWIQDVLNAMAEGAETFGNGITTAHELLAQTRRRHDIQTFRYAIAPAADIAA